ncbi:unnamed protein product [Gongylonema pulchrum]|uniref:Uncharacterized protein n=1 Tax=Gongylonema pulchrum TaxID=637853 RepID=A0A3P6RYP3_9BILA|nr:unnamed protein product [Gongylonema pulchrum]
MDSRETSEKVGEIKRGTEYRFKRLFGYKSKDADEFYDASSAPPENRLGDQEHNRPSDSAQQAPDQKPFISELSWEKSGTARADSHGEFTGRKTPEKGHRSVVHVDANSGGETSDEPYKFTQTPPDVPVSVVQTSETKGSRGFVEQIKRQVTQVCICKTHARRSLKYLKIFQRIPFGGSSQ